MILLIYDPDKISHSIDVFRENLVPCLAYRLQLLIWVAPQERHSYIKSLLPTDVSAIILPLEFPKTHLLRWISSLHRHLSFRLKLTTFKSFYRIRDLFTSLYLQYLTRLYNVDIVFCLAFMNQYVPAGSFRVSGFLHDLCPDLPESSLHNIDSWLHRCSSIFCVSKFTVSQLNSRLYLGSLAPVYVVPPSPRVSHHPYPITELGSDTTSSPSVSSSKNLRCFMPATLLERKGHNVLLQAASLASESDLSLTIVFVGSSTELLRGDIIPSSQYEINLLELRREALSLGVQVDAHGHVDDQSYAQLLESVDLVAFPTLYEGYGLPLSEAVMAGIPVIASDLPPIREQLELYDIADRVILVKPNDATELARALLSFAHENLPKRVRPSTLSSNFKRWTWAMAADKVYSTLLNSLA